MKKLLGIIVLGFLLSGNAYAEETKKTSVYLECKTPEGPYNGYFISTELKSVIVQSDDDIGFVTLDFTPSRYNFEYSPFKNLPMKYIISINRFTGEMIQAIETKLEGKKEINTFKGMCFKRDLDKPKF